jgi:hypothetical protein
MLEQKPNGASNNTAIRESLSNPEFLRSIGAAWRLVFFLLLQVDNSTKSYSANPDQMSEILGVTVGTLSAWIQRLQSLNLLEVKAYPDRIKLTFLSPMNRLTLVMEEGSDLRNKPVETRTREFEESTTEIVLRRRSSAVNKLEEDIDFIFSKLQSFELRLSALEGSFLEQHQARNKERP